MQRSRNWKMSRRMVGRGLSHSRRILRGWPAVCIWRSGVQPYICGMRRLSEEQPGTESRSAWRTYAECVPQQNIEDDFCLPTFIADDCASDFGGRLQGPYPSGTPPSHASAI